MDDFEFKATISGLFIKEDREKQFDVIRKTEAAFAEMDKHGFSGSAETLALMLLDLFISSGLASIDMESRLAITEPADVLREQIDELVPKVDGLQPVGILLACAEIMSKTIGIMDKIFEESKDKEGKEGMEEDSSQWLSDIIREVENGREN